MRSIIFRRFRQLQLPSGQHSTILRSYAQAAIELFMPRQQSRTTMRLSPSICAERANNSFKPNLLRYGKGMAEKACHTFAFTTQVGLTQALGVEMPFRSRARRKHLRARACSSVSDLASCDRGIRSSPSGLSLRQVPAGRIARSCVHPHRPRPILLRQAGKALRFRPCGNQVLSGNLAPNNSFKPSPLRGLVAVSLAGRGPA